MKKIFYMLLFVGISISTNIFAQVLTAEAQFISRSHEKAYGYVGLTYEHEASRGPGAFISGSYQPGFSSVSMGPLFIHNGKSYIGFGIGPGLDYVEGQVGLFGNAYLTIETKSDEERAVGKLVVSAYHYYSPKNGNWNMSYAVYSFTKELSLGVHYQDYGATGFRAQSNLPKGFSVYGVVGKTKNGAAAIIGVNYSWSKN